MASLGLDWVGNLADISNGGLLMRMTQFKCRAPRGFTLIEVLIVIAILLALGGLIVVNLMPVQEKSDVKLQRIQIDGLAQAMDLFKFNMKRWPTEDEGLAALWDKSSIQDEAEQARWEGPYMKNPVTKDNWDHELIYRNPSERGEDAYDIVSMGPDGEEGTEDDITNFDRLKNADGEVGEGDNLAPPPTPESGGD
jgi:general secretion pathway protein G